MYFKNILKGIATSLTGLRLTLAHLWQARKRKPPLYVTSNEYFSSSTGIVTLEYPKETLPLPDIGRYQLYNEIDDCIVCDKCAKICPVDCIEIEAIKAVEDIGKTSDGTVKRLYAAKFDIDMAKCCFCGLCTTVCPTECLTMTSTYDFSVSNVEAMNFHFSDLSPAFIQEKIELLELFQKQKQEEKKLKDQSQEQKETNTSTDKKTLVFKPKGIVKKPQAEPQNPESSSHEEENKKTTGFKPKMKPVFKKPNNDADPS